MKYLLCVLLLTGCSTTVPVTSKFPDAPGAQALSKCQDLVLLDQDAKLSDVARSVTNNYTKYYECSIKNDAWIEWYNTQKQIFEGIK